MGKSPTTDPPWEPEVDDTVLPQGVQQLNATSGLDLAIDWQMSANGTTRRLAIQALSDTTIRIDLNGAIVPVADQGRLTCGIFTWHAPANDVAALLGAPSDEAPDYERFGLNYGWSSTSLDGEVRVTGTEVVNESVPFPLSGGIGLGTGTTPAEVKLDNGTWVLIEFAAAGDGGYDASLKGTVTSSRSARVVPVPDGRIACGNQERDSHGSTAVGVIGYGAQAEGKVEFVTRHASTFYYEATASEGAHVGTLDFLGEQVSLAGTGVLGCKALRPGTIGLATDAGASAAGVFWLMADSILPFSGECSGVLP